MPSASLSSDVVRGLVHRELPAAAQAIVQAANPVPGAMRNAMLVAARAAFNLFAAHAGLAKPQPVAPGGAAQRIQSIIRKVSMMLPATFISEGRVLSLLDKDLLERLPWEERALVDEHVMPIVSLVNGKVFLTDPAAFFDGAFTAAMLAPRCLVIGAEDRRLDRLGHPCTGSKTGPDEIARALPFRRYLPDHLAGSDRRPFRVFRIADGSELMDFSGYDWSRWERETEALGAFREAFAFHRQFSAQWREMMPDVAEILARWQPPSFPAPSLPPSGNYTDLEREAIRQCLQDALSRPDLPSTEDRMPAVTVPAPRKRVNFTVCAPDKDRKPLFRINIGPERRKLELFHNPRSMHHHGGRCLDEFVEQAAAHADLTFTRYMTTVTGYAYGLPGGLDNVRTTLPLLIDRIVDLYPSWRSGWKTCGR